MRRIKIISNCVFDASYNIILVPSRYENKFEVISALQKDMQHVLMEFPKMIWFLCYERWEWWSGMNP
jgi:hypothetical protein